MPQGEMDAFKVNDALAIVAYQYDIVCNGVELSSGAVRNHRPDIMLKAFELAGYSAEEVETQFAGMLNAFRFGAPPHAGIAPGIDRIVMLLAGASAIRDVIAFPLNQQAEDLMMGAPSRVRDEQLKELNIRTVAPPKG
jgi:aspartyl-tRNA synthetase